MTDKDAILTGLQIVADELVREVARLPEAGTLWRLNADEWSQHEVLTHLWIADHFVFLPRMQAIVTVDQPPLPVIDEVALQKAEWRADRSRAALLAAFVADRQAELALLAEHDWDRIGVHAALGPMSLGWVAQYALGHTWEHASQMLRVRLRYELRPVTTA
jgi:hypothetical protein